MFHHKHHIALHSFIVIGSKCFGSQDFHKLWKLIVLTTCSRRASFSQTLDLSSYKDLSCLKALHLPHWFIQSLKITRVGEVSHLFNSSDQIRVLTYCVIWGLSKPISWSIIFLLSFDASLFKEFSRGPKELGFWSLIITLLHRWPKLGFWI